MNFETLSLICLLIIFVAAAIAIWIAGIKLSYTIDVLVNRFIQSTISVFAFQNTFNVLKNYFPGVFSFC